MVLYNYMAHPLAQRRRILAEQEADAIKVGDAERSLLGKAKAAVTGGKKKATKDK